MCNEIYCIMEYVPTFVCKQYRENGPIRVVSPLFDPLDGAQKQEVCHVPVPCESAWTALEDYYAKPTEKNKWLTNNICPSMM